MTIQRKAKNDLNYTFYGELTENRELLSPTQQQLLSDLNYRRRRGSMSDVFHFNASIFTMVEHGEACNSVHCGQRCKGGRVSCGHRFFCQNCANIPANDFLRQTVLQFGRGHWFFVTLSFDSAVPFSSANVDAAERYWRVTRDALDLAAPRWSGCFYREEVAIFDFLPLAIRPHAHILVHLETPDFDVAALNQAFQEAATPHHLVSELTTDVRPIEDLDAYLRTVRYLFKPVDMGTPYRKAWAVLGDRFSGEELIQKRRQVNSELSDFVFGAQLLRPATPSCDFMESRFWRGKDRAVQRVTCRGALHPNSKGGLRSSAAQMARAKDRIDRILREGAKGARRVRAKKTQ